MMPTMMFVMNSICILIVWNGSHSIDEGVMQVGDMLAFIQYTMQIISSFLMISMFSIMMPRAGVSIVRISEILNCDPVIKNPENPKTYSKRIKGLVEFKDVSFRYPDSDEDVLTDITFTAEPGKTTAFIGSTGSGKSTLINLIPRLYVLVDRMTNTYTTTDFTIIELSIVSCYLTIWISTTLIIRKIYKRIKKRIHKKNNNGEVQK